MHGIRLYDCQGNCGRVVARPSRTDRPKLCQDCAIGRVAENARRMVVYGQAYRATRRRQATSQRSST